MKGFLQILRQLFWWSVVLFVVLLVVSFALKNQQTVDFTYYFGLQYQVPLWLIPLAGVLVGTLLGVLMTSAWVLRAKQQTATERRKARKYEREVTHLRSLPMQEGK